MKTNTFQSQFKNASELLEYMNIEYARLHEKYENFFWISYMGDHSVDNAMNEAQVKRDAFRSNSTLRLDVQFHIKKATAKNKARLKIWDTFFGLYQTPDNALPIKKRAMQLETKMLAIKSKRKEGYIDPKTGTFVEASENKMRMMMRTETDEAIRKACFDAMENLYADCLDIYVEMIGARNEFAKTLGFTDFYEYKARIDENMSKKELFSIFENIYKKTKFGFQDIRKLEKSRPGLRKPWNFAYMMTGSFVKEEDPYFRFENVLSYWG
nr:hypothetical protein [bacterium]